MENQENAPQENSPSEETAVQPPSEIAQEHHTPEDSHEHLSKKDLIAQKRTLFFKRAKIAGFSCLGLILLIVAAIIARNIYIENKDKFVVAPENEQETTDIVIKEDEDQTNTNDWEKYSNDQFRFSFEFPTEDSLEIEDAASEAYLAKVVSSDITPIENPNGFNMVKGYILEIKPLAIAARNISKVAEVKKEWFRLQCENTATFGATTETTISDIQGTSFMVTNCNSDFTVSYIPANNYIYEIVQTYKGDLGFKQNYRLRTNLMVKSLAINQILPELDPLVEFYDRGSTLSFLYPRELDTDCCEVPEPPLQFAKELVTLAAGSNDAAVGFYSVFNDRDTLDSMTNNLQTLLEDDYKVIKGRPPEGERIELEVNGEKAYRLNNYSWKGNDFITVYMSNIDAFLVMSIKDFPEDILENIIESMVF